MTIGSHTKDNFDDNNDLCDIKEISAVALVSIVLLTMEDGNKGGIERNQQNLRPVIITGQRNECGYGHMALRLYVVVVRLLIRTPGNEHYPSHQSFMHIRKKAGVLIRCEIYLLQ